MLCLALLACREQDSTVQNKHLDYDKDHEKELIVGRVKSIIERDYAANQQNGVCLISDTSKPISTCKSFFSQSGDEIEDEIANEDDQHLLIHNKYDKEHHLIDRQVQDEDIDLTMTSIVINNERGLISEEVSVYPSGDTSLVRTYVYDQENHIIKLIERDVQGIVDMRQELKYNDFGDLVELDVFIRGKLTQVDKFEHFENHLPHDVKSYDGEGHLTDDVHIEYLFDSTGNWIRKEKVNSIRKSCFVSTRDIEYY